MSTVTGVVEKINSRDVNTRRGPAKSYGINVSGVWYSGGFTAPACSEGDTVELEHKDDQYKSVVSVRVTASGGGVPTTTSPTSSVGVPAKKAFRNGPFPIDPLDGQRSIIRQNAVTNANSYLVTFYGSTDPEDPSIRKPNVEDLLKIARQIEAYTSGDLDAEEAKKALDAMSRTGE